MFARFGSMYKDAHGESGEGAVAASAGATEAAAGDGDVAMGTEPLLEGEAAA